jgi:hypothetical protein
MTWCGIQRVAFILLLYEFRVRPSHRPIVRTQALIEALQLYYLGILSSELEEAIVFSQTSAREVLLSGPSIVVRPEVVDAELLYAAPCHLVCIIYAAIGNSRHVRCS